MQRITGKNIKCEGNTCIHEKNCNKDIRFDEALLTNKLLESTHTYIPLN